MNLDWGTVAYITEACILQEHIIVNFILFQLIYLILSKIITGHFSYTKYTLLLQLHVA